MNGIGDAPFLRRQSIQNLVELNKASMYESGFPIQQLFGKPRLVDSEQVQIDVTRDLREDGHLHSQPANADPTAVQSEGFKIASTLYQQYSYKIKANESARLRMPGAPNTSAVGGFADSAAMIAAAHKKIAEEKVSGKVSGLSNKVLREWEIWAANLLSSQSFTQRIDGTSQTVSTGLQKETASASWATASTDIPADLALFLKAFVDLSGGLPTHCLYSFQLWEDLGKNDAVRDVALPVIGRQPITSLPLDILPGAMRNIEQIVSTAHYKSVNPTTLAKTKAYYWPHYVMTWLRLEPGQKVLDFIYAPTARNDYGNKPALNGRTYQDPRNWVEEVIVEANGAPVVLNEDQIMLFDLSTSALP